MRSPPRTTSVRLPFQLARAAEAIASPATTSQFLMVLMGEPHAAVAAAEVLAKAVRQPLYRVDLAKVVSKYIGETEKNLDRVFDEAAATNAILLFDEADALFGKRTQVKDAHDRYANLELNYLLERLEKCRGTVVLQTTRPDRFKPEVIKRIRFIARAPRPSTSRRGA